ncbi:MAG: carbohydrate binding family 9 domain-containing protein, partial [Bernardetiaceae bacterium]|nr:carbohydrate binding family 9 domain-containing protein [Bernardetiaceae bacterium]
MFDTAVAQPLSILRTETPIRLDGKLEEEVWRYAPKATDFTQNFPSDTLLSEAVTQVQLAYDDTYLYVGIYCESKGTGDYIISSLRRDFDWLNNDNVTIMIDPFNDALNGFSFSVTPYGIEREGMVFEGDNTAVNWDNKWQATAYVDEENNTWTAEMAIPFKTLRYKKDEQIWRMNFTRNDARTNERSAWARVPQGYEINTIAFAKEVEFEGQPPASGSNISLIPYLTGDLAQDRLAGTPTAYSANAGGDAKIGVSPSLNLDITVNPDFSQVEVDRQVTNLSRFEIFFPEQRQFFLENSDLFSRFGFTQIRPFFSRRIGIGLDTATQQIVQNPIYYGARLSGKIGQKWRVGLMNMQTARDRDAGILSQNYTVAAVQKQIFGRSNIGGIFVNRQAFGDDPASPFTRMAGLDYNIQSKDNKWRGKIFYHKAFLPNSPSGSSANASYLNYRTRKWNIAWNHEYVGENYDINDIGFVARRGHWRFEDWIGYRFYPQKSKLINNHG